MTEYNNQQQHLQNDENENGSGLTLHDLLQMVLANWYWFALSVLICLGVAYYYLASTPKIYSRTATILVKDSRKGGDMELGVFSDLVGFQNRRNVDNEVYILQSHRLMSEVVKRLHLTVNYSVRDGLRTLDLYGRSPIEVDFIDDDNQRLSLEVTELEDGRIKLADFDDKYLTKQEKYGLPLDCRKKYTKSDWIMWTAAMADDQKTFQQFLDPLYKYVDETPTRVPISDWYNTDDATWQSFRARSVIGGHWMKVLMDRELAENNANK